jgi:hypothetical protein
MKHKDKPNKQIRKHLNPLRLLKCKRQLQSIALQTALATAAHPAEGQPLEQHVNTGYSRMYQT